MDYNKFYDSVYYKNDFFEDYKNRDIWIPKFEIIAKRIVKDINPKTVLDVGCAMGYLVEALRALGVEAYGVDVSEYAISMVSDEIKPFCAVASVLDNLPSSFPIKYDLLVTIEVLEHLFEEDGKKAVEKLCSYSNDILFTASPTDFEEKTHFNVQQPEYWAKEFAVHGFFEFYSINTDYLPTWGMRFKKQETISVVDNAKMVYQAKNNIDILQRTSNEYKNVVIEYKNLIKVHTNLSEAHENLNNEYNKLLEVHQNVSLAHEGLNNEYNKLLEVHQNLSLEHEGLNKEFNKLLEVHKNVSLAHENLENEYKILNKKNVDLIDKHGILLNDYEAISKKLKELENTNIELGENFIEEQNKSIKMKSELDNYIVSLYNKYDTDTAYYKKEISDKTYELNKILTSKGYRGLKKIYRLKAFFTPKRNKEQKQNSSKVNILNWSNFKRAIYYTKIYGFKSVYKKIKAKLFEPHVLSYAIDNDIINNYEYQKDVLFNYNPLISIVVPTYNIDKKYLLAMLDSVKNQTYSNWELCIADGKSKNAREIKNIISKYSKVKYIMLDNNMGISGNTDEALKLASGEYVGLLDHDDELTPNALFEIVSRLQEKQYDFIYSDKDMMNAEGTLKFNPFYKPGFSPDIMYSANYFTHFCVIKHKIIKDVGGFDSKTDGAQDWDMFLKVCEKAKDICHVPEILYHWRIIPSSVASGISAKPYALEAQLNSIRNHINRIGKSAKVDFYDKYSYFIKINWEIPKETFVSIVIYNSSTEKKLHENIQSVKNSIKHINYEIIIVSNNNLKSSYKEYTLLFDPNIKEYYDAYSFGAKKAKGDILLFMNSDHLFENRCLIDDMICWTLQKEIGIVFPEFLRSDNTINSTGLIVNRGSVYDLYAGEPICYYGVMGHSEWVRNFTACREFCFTIKKSVFEDIGGFDSNYKEYAMIELCLKSNKLNLRNTYLPYIKVVTKEKFKDIITNNNIFNKLVEKFDIKEFDKYTNKNYEKSYIDACNLEKSSHKEDNIQNKSVDNPSGIWEGYSKDATVLAEWYDFSLKDVENNNKIINNKEKLALPIKSICWFLPDFDYASYAGLYTIFRFANFLQTKCDINNSFAIVGTPKLENTRKEIARVFPELGKCKLYEVAGKYDLVSVPHVDAVVASLWTTAYMLLSFNKTNKKFYFIQDYEPYFYPAGATFAQALESYKFGYIGITNTLGLKEVYEKDFNGLAESLMPCIDKDVFYSNNVENENKIKKVFFYGRPGHPRNGFELGIAAFKVLKRKMGDNISIVSAGAEWNPSDYGLDGVVENLGRLKYEETGDLYRTCDVGFVMMFTKHPSYLPFELMACGCPVVSNFNESTKWFLKNNVNCILTESTATRIAENIEKVLKDNELSNRIKNNALEEISMGHTDWNKELMKIKNFMDNPLLK